MMATCPWLGWGGGLRNKTGFLAVLGGVVVSAAVIWALGFRQPTALLGASAAVGIVLGAALLLADKANRSQAGTLGALGAHDPKRGIEHLQAGLKDPEASADLKATIQQELEKNPPAAVSEPAPAKDAAAKDAPAAKKGGKKTGK